jgi:hypothetical protein
MISGKNCELVSESYKRVGSFFTMLTDIKNRTEKSLSITHDFFMRVIEIYIKNRGQPNPSITYGNLKNTKRNLYLHGFATDFSLSKFLPFRKI